MRDTYQDTMRDHDMRVLRMKREQDNWERRFETTCPLCDAEVNMLSNAAILRHMNSSH